MRPEWIRTARTALQVLITVVPLIPVLVPLVGLSTTVGIGSALIVGAGATARIMQIPQINDWVNKLLRAE